MAKSSLRLEAIKLRSQGESVKKIAHKLGVSKSSASLWVRHITLTPKQIDSLAKNVSAGRIKGGLKGAQTQKNRRLEKITAEEQSGLKQFKHLSTRQLHVCGLCLYWAEGTKTNRKVNFCNSNPDMINLYIRWLRKIFDIPATQLSCCVGINEIHKSRDNEVRAYWSKITGIPLKNFIRTSFKKFPPRKHFLNFNRHFGTLSVSVKQPARIYYKILGQIYGLSKAT